MVCANPEFLALFTSVQRAWARLRSLRIAISEVRHLIGGLPYGPLQFICECAEPIDNRAIMGYRATTR